MAESTEIQWADATFNSWIGCTKVGPGCDHCYAETLDRNRFSKTLGPMRDGTREQVVHWGPGAPRHRTKPSNWKAVQRWNDTPFYECDACGWRGDDLTEHPKGHSEFAMTQVRRRVFCASLADVFDNEVDPQWRADLFALIENTPKLDWLLLTKRVGNVMSMIPERWALQRLPRNVWLGSTMVNQEERDRDLRKLINVPATVHFLSLEPLLGPITLNLPCGHDGRSLIDWVIVGGESGHGARPAHPDWFRSLRDQCAVAGVPLLFKQHGEWLPEGQSTVAAAGQLVAAPFHTFEDGTRTARIGKKAAGRLLDGRTHDEFPASVED